ncbi:MAG: hypothetical protein RMK84_04225 [Oscillochloridaceae bacterium]|nr:hypothetical protein [Chloroflexaceae bacterium]MDW8389309.1 hypothetical protein [Oscillochloridaceae bacterium]
MARTILIEGTQQRLGRRLGESPYYRIAERAPGRLALESRPELNRPAAFGIIGGGVALLVVGALIALSGLISAGAGAGFAAAALAAVLGGLLGGFGYQRLVGGYAVLTTRNCIVIDAGEEAITFTQSSRVGKVREQRIPFNRVSGLRLRRRPLATGMLRRVRPIVALELIVGSQVWIVDSAADAADLEEVAVAVAEALGREFDTGAVPDAM